MGPPSWLLCMFDHLWLKTGRLKRPPPLLVFPGEDFHGSAQGKGTGLLQGLCLPWACVCALIPHPQNAQLLLYTLISLGASPLLLMGLDTALSSCP